MRYCLVLFLIFMGFPLGVKSSLSTDTVQEVALAPLVESPSGEQSQEGTMDGTPEPVLPPEYELYEQGRHYLTQQRIDLAQKAFEEIVEKYQGTSEAILARFWLGEFMLKSNNYSGATIAFGQAYGALKKAQKQKEFSQDKFHGEHDRLPEILAKLAYSLKMINKRGDACITLRQINKDYETRSATLDWYTAKLSKELKCR
ncbi:MAG TPA: hypothetical protein DD412_00975 [Holosporales bacterium]|nr:hypothetical protein [Holosporales bacterium]